MLILYSTTPPINLLRVNLLTSSLKKLFTSLNQYCFLNKCLSFKIEVEVPPPFQKLKDHYPRLIFSTFLQKLSCEKNSIFALRANTQSHFCPKTQGKGSFY